MSDWIRANNLNSPTEYFIDPTSQESQQAMKAKADQATQQAQAEAAGQKELLTVQHDFKMAEQAQEIEYKKWSDELDAKVKQYDTNSKFIAGVTDGKNVNP